MAITDHWNLQAMPSDLQRQWTQSWTMVRLTTMSIQGNVYFIGPQANYTSFSEDDHPFHHHMPAWATILFSKMWYHKNKRETEKQRENASL